MADSSTTPQEVQLANFHEQMLRESGIADEIVEARGYETVADAKGRPDLKLPRGIGSGLAIPLYRPDGAAGPILYRLDDPKEIKAKKGASRRQRFIQYALPTGQKAFLDCPPRCREALKDVAATLWVTDSLIAADALASQGQCAVAVVGISDYMGKKNPEEIVRLTDWDHINLKNRPVRVIFDPDALADPQANKILQRLTVHLGHKSPHVKPMYPAKAADNGQKGIVEYLAAGKKVEDLDTEAEPSTTTPTPKAAEYALVDDERPAMRRPLALIGGHAYVAMWTTMKQTTTQELDESGNLITLEPPRISVLRRWAVLRDDGAAFGGATDLRELGFETHLDDPLEERTRWSAAGMRRFRSGERPNPTDIVPRITAILDRFMDFRKSISDQRTMCELAACFIVSTWFLEAFNVASYMWITGEKGSGKTNLLILMSEMSYLGCFTSPSGSFASLRDMADYGATLCIDDAENIADPRQTPPDKRDLLLAGNRRGITVTLKEPSPDNKWVTRRVHVYASRAFSAIGTPDPTLSSRCIIVPLLRTSNHQKANSDPYDYEKWASERGLLVDDLWAMALAYQAEMVQFDRWVGKHAQLSGRNLQPWRAIFAVARWLETKGVEGIYGRMEALSLAYQQERAELETPDTTRILLQALCQHAVGAVGAIGAIGAKVAARRFRVTVSELAATAQKLIREEEIGLDPNCLDPRRVGRLLSRLRFKETPRPGGKGSRRRDIPVADLLALCDSYKVTVPSQLLKSKPYEELALPNAGPHDASAIDGTVGTDGTDGTESDMPPFEFDEEPEECSLNMACNGCGGIDYWERGDGALVCSTCHPQS